MEICTRVDVVRDGGGDDRQDARRAFAAEIEPCEEPVLPPEDQSTKLTLAPVVGQLDLAVLEEQQESRTLAMQVSEARAEWCLRRRDGALLVEPGAELVGD